MRLSRAAAVARWRSLMATMALTSAFLRTPPPSPDRNSDNSLGRSAPPRSSARPRLRSSRHPAVERLDTRGITKSGRDRATTPSLLFARNATDESIPAWAGSGFPACRALEGSLHHRRDARLGIRGGLARDPIAGSQSNRQRWGITSSPAMLRWWLLWSNVGVRHGPAGSARRLQLRGLRRATLAGCACGGEEITSRPAARPSIGVEAGIIASLGDPTAVCV